MHPEDAERLGLTDGARVTITNERGEIHAALQVTGDIRPELRSV